MAALRSDSPIQFVKGVGPARAEWFTGLGLGTVGDLLEYYPFRYESEAGLVDIADLRPGMTATVQGEVQRVRGRRPGLRAEIYDGTESCTLRWFQQYGSRQSLYVGAMVLATGKVQEYNDRLEIVQPRVQVFEPDAVILSRPHGARRVGVYRGNATLKSPLIRRTVQHVLEQPRLPVEEIVPPELVGKHDLPSREAAIRQMHSPSSEPELERARARLAYEEFLLMELAMALRRYKLVSLQRGRKLHVTPEIDRRIRARFPFSLTRSQEEVVRDIIRDLDSGRPMTRLLQGDVGSGKTVVALYACLIAVAHGRQAAIMAPTEILAAQHFANIERYLAGSRVRHTLLRGGQSKKVRAEALAQIERGEIDLVVGTQALLEKDVAFRDLAMVVVDEQHKFGVLQRADFRTKGPLPHYLVMTATPIPRTLAMTVFGDLDVSIIREMPPGRGKTITKIVTSGQWKTVMGYVRQRLEAGEQAYVVCPLIGEEKVTKAQRHEATEGRDEGTEGHRDAGIGTPSVSERASRTVPVRERPGWGTPYGPLPHGPAEPCPCGSGPYGVPHPCAAAAGNGQARKRKPRWPRRSKPTGSSLTAPGKVSTSACSTVRCGRPTNRRPSRPSRPASSMPSSPPRWSRSASMFPTRRSWSSSTLTATACRNCTNYVAASAVATRTACAC